MDDKTLDAMSADELRDLLKDRRRQRTSGVPDDVPAGTKEYQKAWREKNRLKQRLYQKRTYLLKRKATMALQKYEAKSDEELRAAIAEVDEQLSLMRELRRDEVAETRSTPVEVTDSSPKLPDIPFVREQATRFHLTYEEAYAIMHSDDYAGDESFNKKMNEGLADILKGPTPSGE
jgi:hypothetical protein